MKNKPNRRLQVLLLILALVSGVAVYRYSNRPGALKGLPVSGGKEFSLKIKVESYQQGDSRWSRKKLGSTNAPMRSYGCTICATAMALTSQGYEILPDQLNDELLENDGFTKSGLLIWKGIEPVTNGTFGVILNDRPTHKILDRELESGNPIIAKVLFQGEVWHWVLIVGKEGLDYLIHDPLVLDSEYTTMSDYSTGIFSIRYLKKL